MPGPKIVKMGANADIYDTYADMPGAAVIDSAGAGKHGDVPVNTPPTVQVKRDPQSPFKQQTVKGSSALKPAPSKRKKKVSAQEDVIQANLDVSVSQDESEEIIEAVKEEPDIKVKFTSQFGTITDYFHDSLVQSSWLILIKNAGSRSQSFQPPAPTDSDNPPIFDIEVESLDKNLKTEIFAGKVMSLGLSLDLADYGIELTILGIVQ
jgi:hypothetical protein